MLPMEIDSIRVSLMNYQRVVILKEKNTDRYLPIWIGSPEADAIAVKLQDVAVPRPLTHDLLGSIIGNLGARVDHVVVSDLQDDTFYAKIAMVRDGQTMEVDCRPSDAIAIAVRSNVTIFVEDEVVAQAGVVFNGDDEFEASDEVPQKTIDPEELESLSAFSDFIDSLDLGDLGEQ